MNHAVRRAILHWLALLLIASAMFAGAWLPLPPAVRPLLLLPSIGMAALIATGFMRLPAGGVLSWGFAVAALSHAIVEKPFLRLKTRFEPSRQRMQVQEEMPGETALGGV